MISRGIGNNALNYSIPFNFLHELSNDRNKGNDRNDIEDTLECMRGKSAEEITAVEYYVDDYSLNFFPFVVTVDETFLPLSPRTMLENTRFKNISILIGSNANEGYWSLLYLLPEMFPNNELKMSDRDLSQQKYQEAVDQIFNFYPKPVSGLSFIFLPFLKNIELDSIHLG